MQTAANRISFSQLASLLLDHLKNLHVISEKLDHRILQLSVLMVQLNLLMCACDEVWHDFVLHTGMESTVHTSRTLSYAGQQLTETDNTNQMALPRNCTEVLDVEMPDVDTMCRTNRRCSNL